MVVRSDVYRLDESYALVRESDEAPLITLDSDHFKLIADFEAHLPHGAPSLKEATSLSVEGDWTFGADVLVRGDVTLEDRGEPSRVEAGAVLEG